MDFIKFVAAKEAMHRQKGDIGPADRLKDALNYLQTLEGRDRETI